MTISQSPKDRLSSSGPSNAASGLDGASGKAPRKAKLHGLAEAIFSTVPTPLLVLDKEFTVAAANDAFYRQFRVSPQETIGQPIWQLGSGQWNIAGLRRLLSDVLPRNASLVNFEVVHNFPGIGARTMLLNGRTIFPRHGKANYILLAIQDITAQRAAERELKELNKQLRLHNEELSHAYTELEAFSYSVSHDLRTPLRGIAGFSQAVLEDYSDVLDEIGRDYLQRIRLGTIRMAHLIDDILQLSKLSRVKLEMADIDLRAEAEQVIAELQRSDPTRQATIKLPEAARATGDRHLVVIALTNLLNNAWKFTSKTSDARIEMGVEQDDGHDVYFVRDNGIGFDTKYVEQIFQPFNRLHSITDYPGSGIGLAIVHRVIRRHHGRVWATSSPEQGTTFYFTLESEPVQQPE